MPTIEIRVVFLLNGKHTVSPYLTKASGVTNSTTSALFMRASFLTTSLAISNTRVPSYDQLPFNAFAKLTATLRTGEELNGSSVVQQTTRRSSSSRDPTVWL